LFFILRGIRVSKNGWVKLHRKMLDNVDLEGDPTARILLMHLLLLANPKGQVLTSTRSLSKLLGFSNSTVHEAIKRLETYQMAERSTEHKKSLILICNWYKYQTTTERPTERQPNASRTLAERRPLDVRIENENKNRELNSDFKKAVEKADKERLDKWKSTHTSKFSV
jgi:DNA-binding transcriptional MocR family regulator